MVGVATGTYSSIYVAAPILLWLVGKRHHVAARWNAIDAANWQYPAARRACPGAPEDVRRDVADMLGPMKARALSDRFVRWRSAT